MFFVKKGSKYNNVSQNYNGNHYDSKKEAAYAKELDLRVKAKDIKSWERQVKVSLDVNDYHITNYYLDFKIIHNDDSIEWIEVKGFETEVWRLKKKLFEAKLQELFPGSVYTIIK